MFETITCHMFFKLFIYFNHSSVWIWAFKWSVWHQTSSALKHSYLGQGFGEFISRMKSCDPLISHRNVEWVTKYKKMSCLPNNVQVSIDVSNVEVFFPFFGNVEWVMFKRCLTPTVIRWWRCWWWWWWFEFSGNTRPTLLPGVLAICGQCLHVLLMEWS